MRDEDIASLFTEFERATASFAWIDVSSAVLTEASEPFPTAVKTSDAIHLASAKLWRQKYAEDLVFITHDKQQAIAAQALGFEVEGA